MIYPVTPKQLTLMAWWLGQRCVIPSCIILWEPICTYSCGWQPMTRMSEGDPASRCMTHSWSILTHYKVGNYKTTTQNWQNGIWTCDLWLVPNAQHLAVVCKVQCICNTHDRQVVTVDTVHTSNVQTDVCTAISLGLDSTSLSQY
jgi:hypothetical protein